LSATHSESGRVVSQRIEMTDRPADSAPPCVYRFDCFELDPVAGRLRSEGELVALDPTPQRLLAVLVRHHDRVVSKQELLAEVWGDTAVSEAALSSALRDLRRALGDDGRSQRLVATFRGRGYQLAVPVTEHPVGARGGPQPLVGPLPFVGRRALLDSLTRGLESQVGVLLEGPPGIGKTRLLEELCEWARSHGWHVLRPSGVASGNAPPYWPFVEALRTWADHREIGLRELARGLEGTLVPIFPEWRDPRFEGDESSGADRREEDGTARASRFALFDAVGRLLERVSRRHPVLLAFDDLQDADADSRELLVHLASRPESSRLGFVVTSRPVDGVERPGLKDTVRDLDRSGRVQSAALAGLDAAEAADLFEACGRRIDPALAETLVQRTGGNPLLLRELMRLHLDEDPRVALPEGARQAVAEHLDGLPSSRRATLEFAAMLGPSAALPVIARAMDLSPVEVSAELQACREAHIPLFFEGGSVRFEHALFVEALLSALPAGRRLQVATRSAEALEAALAGAPGSRVAELARLFGEAASDPGGEAELARKALVYALAASRQAAIALAHEEALHWCERAVESVVPAGMAGSVLHAEVLIQLAGLRRTCRRMASALEASRQAGDVARRLDDPVLLARATLSSTVVTQGDHEGVYADAEALERLGERRPDLRIRLLAIQAARIYHKNEPERVASLVREAQALARTVDDPFCLGLAEFAKVFATLNPDGLEERRAALRRCLPRFDAHDPTKAWTTSFYLLAAELEAGDFASVDAVTADVARRTRALGVPPVHVRSAECVRALFSGRYDDAERLIMETGALADPEEPNLFLFVGTMMSELRLQQGRLEELANIRAVTQGRGDGSADVPAVRAFFALVDFERGEVDRARADYEDLARAGFADLPIDFHWHTALSYLAELSFAFDDAERAEQLYELLAPHPDRNIVFNVGLLCRGAVSHYLGLLATTVERYDDAERHFERALELHEGWQAKPYVAHAQQASALMRERRGRLRDGQEARSLVRQARATAEELGMGLLLQRMRRAGQI